MKYQILKESKISKARNGLLKTKHGEIETPFFMPVATRGVIKGIANWETRELNPQIILSNTYHLMLHPGKDFIKRKGGLHKFMGWSGPILTDSGGYQIFSLSSHRTIKDQGVDFKDPVSGRKVNLSPEESILIQRAIGSDIMICLDECTPFASQREDVERAVVRTIAWAKRCKEEHQKNPQDQLLFAVGQGDKYLDLREECLQELKKINFDGYCYGGMAPLKTVYEMLDKVIPFYPREKPRYLMGVGYPDNLVESVKRGIDMFDCVIPTREGRHGRIFLRNRKIKLGKAGFFETSNLPCEKFKKDNRPLDIGCNCSTCKNYSRAYLDYLFRIGDYLGPRLASLHNLAFYLDLMREIRESIKKGKL